jgi:hypothetical protein
MLLFLGPGLLLLTVAGVEAQDTWSFYFTPQVWLENVRNSGFAPTTNAGGTAFSGVGYVVVPTKYLRTDGSSPTSDLFPQWGGSSRRSTVGGPSASSSQYLHYDTTQDFFIQAQSIVLCGAGRCPGRAIRLLLLLACSAPSSSQRK